MSAPLMVAVDGRPASEDALRFALSRAAESGTGVHVVHVSSGSDEIEAGIRSRIQSIVSSHTHSDVVVSTTMLDPVVESGRAATIVAETLEKYIDDAPVNFAYLVLGNQETSSLRTQLVGSVTSQIIESRSLPVLQVPGPE